MTQFREGRARKIMGLRALSPLILTVIMSIVTISCVLLYSAAQGSMSPWAFKQLIRFVFGFVLMLGATLIDIRTWYMLAYPLYGITLLLLIGVEFMGFVGMGAQRWIDLYVFQLQPSELMKIALILALARYAQDCPKDDLLKNKNLIVPMALVGIPALLTMRQPDLGTALLLIFSGITVLFLAGVQLWKFILSAALTLGSLPILWRFLHDYQKRRVLVFLNPEMDHRGAGYHVTQSKIALGSGGFWGKGWMAGSQSHLNFLPEKQTDFIFTMFCEEFGMIGALTLLALYAMLIGYFFAVAYMSRSRFAKLTVIALATSFFLYIAINIAMVMGVMPVVGVPLPLMSYGGTSMLTMLISFGIIFSARVYHDVRLSRV